MELPVKLSADVGVFTGLGCTIMLKENRTLLLQQFSKLLHVNQYVPCLEDEEVDAIHMECGIHSFSNTLSIVSRTCHAAKCKMGKNSDSKVEVL